MKKILMPFFMFCLMLSLQTFAAVNINTATSAELQTLTGIGPKKARAIINYRNKNGKFKSLNDLENVKGISTGIVKKIKKDASVSGRTTVNTKAKTSKKEAKSSKKSSKDSSTKKEKSSKKEGKKNKQDKKTKKDKKSKQDKKSKKKETSKKDKK